MKALWILLLGLFLGACGTTEKVAGGSAVEGETFSARLVGSDGEPLAGRRVWVMAADSSWSLETVSDSLGNIRISVPAGILDLILKVEDRADGEEPLVFRIRLRPSLDTTLVAQRWGALSGRVASLSGWIPLSMEQPGLGLYDSIEAGSYHLGHVPPGSWELRLWADSAGTRKWFSLGSVTMPSGGIDLFRDLSVENRAYLRRDFDTSVGVSLAGRCGGEGDTGCLSTATGLAAWSGTSLCVSMPALTDRADTAWLWLVPPDEGKSLLVGPRDSLVFMARGTGCFRLWLGDASVASGLDVNLTPAWQRHAFAVADLLGDPASPGVRNIGISPSSQMYLVLDDLIFIAP